MGFFDEEPKKVTKTSREIELENDLKQIKSDFTLKEKELEHSHTLALKEKEFELKHFKDDEVQKLNHDLAEEKQKNAVLHKENEMLAKITNLNADIIDIKDLVANLINKLPEIKLNNLTLNGNNNEKRD